LVQVVARDGAAGEHFFGVGQLKAEPIEGVSCHVVGKAASVHKQIQIIPDESHHDK